MLVVRLVFVAVIFGGVVVFEFQLWMATSLAEALTVILKVGLCTGTAFLAWEICVTWVRPTRVSYRKKLMSPDVTVLPPVIHKKNVLKSGLMVPPNEGGRFNRVQPSDLKDDDIICLEIVEQEAGEYREFLAIEGAQEGGMLPLVTLNSLMKSYAGHKLVRSLVREWVENTKDWKRFCFQVNIDQGKVALRSVATGTLIFMMGWKDKTMVAWQANDSKRGIEVGSWERFEFRSWLTTPDMGPLVRLWYTFTASFVKWQPIYERFNVTKKNERAVTFALWSPNLVKDATPYAPLSKKIRAGSFSYSYKRGSSRQPTENHDKLF